MMHASSMPMATNRELIRLHFLGERIIAVLTGCKEACRWVERLAECLDGDYSLFLCKDLTLPEETVREIAPAERQAVLRREQTFTRSIIVFVHKEIIP
jgi:hypothetical protein